MIPNGVLLLNVKKNHISFANKELRTIMNAEDNATFSDLSEKLADFLMQDIDPNSNGGENSVVVN